MTMWRGLGGGSDERRCEYGSRSDPDGNWLWSSIDARSYVAEEAAPGYPAPAAPSRRPCTVTT